MMCKKECLHNVHTLHSLSVLFFVVFICIMYINKKVHLIYPEENPERDNLKLQPEVNPEQGKALVHPEENPERDNLKLQPEVNPKQGN